MFSDTEVRTGYDSEFAQAQAMVGLRDRGVPRAIQLEKGIVARFPEGRTCGHSAQCPCADSDEPVEGSVEAYAQFR